MVAGSVVIVVVVVVSSFLGTKSVSVFSHTVKLLLNSVSTFVLCSTLGECRGSSIAVSNQFHGNIILSYCKVYSSNYDVLF